MDLMTSFWSGSTMGQKSGREIRVGNFVSLSNFRKKRILGSLHFYYDDKNIYKHRYCMEFFRRRDFKWTN